MPIRAESDRKFLLRFLVIGIVLLGFGGWCLYDGFIAYPKKLKISEAFYEETSSPDGVQEWTPISAKEWDAIARRNGWESAEKPKTPDEVRALIWSQYGMAAMSFLVGLPILIHWLLSRKQWIEVDQQGLRNSRRQNVAFDLIDKIDKSRWERKGIAKVHWTEGNRKGVFVIDDMKFLREPTDRIMEFVESRIDAERVFGAPLERELTASAPAAPSEEDEHSGTSVETD